MQNDTHDVIGSELLLAEVDDVLNPLVEFAGAFQLCHLLMV